MDDYQGHQARGRGIHNGEESLRAGRRGGSIRRLRHASEQPEAGAVSRCAFSVSGASHAREREGSKAEPSDEPNKTFILLVV